MEIPPSQESSVEVVELDLTGEQLTDRALVTFNTVPVVVEDDAWFNEADPEARVERFLDENASLFAASESIWKQIKIQQADCTEIAQASTGQLNREKRRQYQKTLGSMANPKSMLAAMKANAYQEHADNRDAMQAMTYDQKIAHVNAREAEKVAAVRNDLANKKEWQAFAPFAELFVKNQQLLAGHWRALVTQETVLGKLRYLLKDPKAATFFTHRLVAMADNSSTGRQEYPGLLELVATHVAEKGNENMVQDAMARCAPPPATYAREFLGRRLEDGANEHSRKELSAAYGVMRLMSVIMANEYNTDPSRVADLIAAHAEQWPVELTNELHIFAAAKEQANWQNIRDALQPFVREGRFPTGKGTVTVNLGSSGPKGPAGTKSKPSSPTTRRGGTGKGVARVRVGAAGQDHEDIIDTSEKEPISRFAVLSNMGRKSQKYALEEVASLDELFTLSNLADYAEHHRGDSSIADMLKAALAHLANEPFDNACTQRLRQAEYVLVDDDRESSRHARRFSAQHFPHAQKGPVGSKTRIIYDIVKKDGQPVLVIYGAFIKQDIETITTLPQR